MSDEEADARKMLGKLRQWVKGESTMFGVYAATTDIDFLIQRIDECARYKKALETIRDSAVTAYSAFYQNAARKALEAQL